MPNGELAEVKKLIEGLESKLQPMSAGNNLPSEVKAICQDLESKLEKWQESRAMSKISETSDFGARVERALSGIDFLVNHFKIAKDVTEYGSLIIDTYRNFMARVDDEFRTLEQRTVEGPEYVFRSNMLLFSLMMARVYMGLYASEDSLKRVEDRIERAKRLV